jgi:hypothetical protein
MSQVPERQRELEGLGTVSDPRRTPRTPAPPPQNPMQPMPDPNAALWQSPERLAAIRRNEAEDGPEAWVERQRRADEVRHREGLARVLEAERRYRDHRDAKDAERTLPR